MVQAGLVCHPEFLAQLIDLGRMPRGTGAIVAAGSMREFLPQAPQADLSIFGLQDQIDVQFMSELTQKVHSTCIFVHDSGHESALA